MRLIGLAVVLAVSLLLAPLVAGAQQAPKTTKIGALFSVTPAAAAPNLEAFRKGLRELGHVEGKTFVLMPRYGEARPERLPELARSMSRSRNSTKLTSSRAKGRKASMFLAELGPGANMGKHYHPGDAFAYILE